MMEAANPALARRTLSAPQTPEETHILSLVVLTVSTLSMLGSGWMILGFLCFKSLRSFRHHLILGLSISDFVMAVNFMSSSASTLRGKYMGLPEQSVFCQVNGFLVQLFVVQTDYWVLIIALCTYFMLVGHKRCSDWVQNNKLAVYGLPWAFSTCWASLGLSLAGYGSIGAWCWFTADKVRLFVNFIPRWCIIISMMLMYWRVYVVLFKVQERLTNANSTTVGSSRPPSHLPPASPLRSRFQTEGDGYGPKVVVRDNRHLKKIARLMMMYPIAYVVIWTLPTGVRIYHATTGRPVPFALETIDKACICMQGLMDAIIYGVNETSRSAWRNLLFPQPFPTGATHEYDEQPPPKSALRGSGYALGDEEMGTSTGNLGFELAVKSCPATRVSAIAQGEEDTLLAKAKPKKSKARDTHRAALPEIVVTDDSDRHTGALSRPCPSYSPGGGVLSFDPLISG